MRRIIVITVLVSVGALLLSGSASAQYDYYMRLKKVGLCWKCTTVVLPAGSRPPKDRFMQKCTREQAIECQSRDGECEGRGAPPPIRVRIVP